MMGLSPSLEPYHEIMALFILCKFILQKPSSGARCLILVGPFVYFYTSCVRTVRALVRLCGCVGSPEPSQIAYVISAIILWAGSFKSSNHPIKSLFQDLQVQVFYAILDQIYHGEEIQGKTTTEVMAEVQNKYHSLPYVSNTVSTENRWADSRENLSFGFATR